MMVGLLVLYARTPKLTFLLGLDKEGVSREKETPARVAARVAARVSPISGFHSPKLSRNPWEKALYETYLYCK
jgi:hypothetical protein